MSANVPLCPSWLRWWRKILEIVVMLLNQICKE